MCAQKGSVSFDQSSRDHFHCQPPFPVTSLAPVNTDTHRAAEFVSELGDGV